MYVIQRSMAGARFPSFRDLSIVASVHYSKINVTNYRGDKNVVYSVNFLRHPGVGLYTVTSRRSIGRILGGGQARPGARLYCRLILYSIIVASFNILDNYRPRSTNIDYLRRR